MDAGDQEVVIDVVDLEVMIGEGREKVKNEIDIEEMIEEIMIVEMNIVHVVALREEIEEEIEEIAHLEKKLNLGIVLLEKKLDREIAQKEKKLNQETVLLGGILNKGKVQIVGEEKTLTTVQLLKLLTKRAQNVMCQVLKYNQTQSENNIHFFSIYFIFIMNT